MTSFAVLSPLHWKHDHCYEQIPSKLIKILIHSSVFFISLWTTKTHKDTEKEEI